MQVCPCGCIKIEHRELGLCGSCNRARIKAERPVVVKERKPIAKISTKRTAALKVRAVAYREVKLKQLCCAACGTRQNLTPSHVLTQKQFPQHRANPRNIVVLCGDRCHPLWEDNKTLFRELCPEVWQLKMSIMQELEPAYYRQFISKHFTI